MVSIIILALAILPMVGMFDMGLNSATEQQLRQGARPGEPEAGGGQEPALRRPSRTIFRKQGTRPPTIAGNTIRHLVY